MEKKSETQMIPLNIDALIDEMWMASEFRTGGAPNTYHAGATDMYRHLSPEMESLRRERDAYRKALIGINSDTWHKEPNEELTRIRTIAKFILDQYPPSIVTDKTENNE